ncbi:LytR family transcriptional regulator [Ornithinibacillus sp. L9]|uniref:LytR family transcriptional regulator n=1 Tax=Ornithinibacillus caprae TaxID=2678566 RepID=A0A6N8FDU7_9BACI|nr:LCP family protein [Ornithinibacillus caprae]MUK87371.1 LytR family transcriptional regulator [Ornithinibacillus caprae]
MSEEKQKESRMLKKRKARNKKKIILLCILIPITVIFITTLSYSAYIYFKVEQTVDESYKNVGRENEVSNLREEPIDPMIDNVSILIIGVDDSERRGYEEQSRSDTLILATFNKEQEDIKLLSIPRDTYAYVPEVDYYTKINHAHFYGGAKAAIETVEEFLHVPVDYYVRLNFEAFIEVIDSLGGIHYDVPFEMYEMDSKDKKDAIHLLPGYQKINGEEALALARTRKYDSDIERGKRQQEIIKTVIKEAASASTVFKLSELIDSVGKNMTTNLTFEDMKTFASYGLSTDLSISSLNLDGYGGYMDDGLWYYVADEESRSEIEITLKDHLDLESNAENYDDIQSIQRLY